MLAPPAPGRFHRTIGASGGRAFRATETAEGFTDDPQPGHPNSSGEAAARMLVTSGAVADRAAARVKVAAMSPEETAVFLRSRAAFDVLRAFPPGASGDFIEL